jgi:hypothetical protein
MARGLKNAASKVKITFERTTTLSDGWRRKLYDFQRRPIWMDFIYFIH